MRKPVIQREPLKISPFPNGPWERLSADLCGPVLFCLHRSERSHQLDLLQNSSDNNGYFSGSLNRYNLCGMCLNNQN